MSCLAVRYRFVFVVVCLAVLPACSKSPTDPGTVTMTNCSAIVGNKGTVTAHFADGTSFSGIVPTGGATLSATTVVLFGQSNDNTTLTVAMANTLGTTAFGLGIVSPDSLQVQTRSCTAGTGLWAASIIGGSGSVTLGSLSATGASGSFFGTLVPQAGSGASGNKVITDGSFNVTF